MDLQLQGKRAVVTGGSRGIGRQIALNLAREGCDVAICARTEGPLKEAAAEMAKETGRRIVPIPCNTRDGAQLKNLMDTAARELGGIDILVNNAARLGGSIVEDFDNLEPQQVLADMEEKVVGYLLGTRAAAPYLKQNGWGRVINISGQAGRTPGNAVGAGARNAAVINLNKSIAAALGPHGINVVCVVPGGTLTEYSDEQHAARAQREGKTVEALRQEMADRTQIKHLVTAEDVAYVATFLCSPLAISIHGEAIFVNGGASADVHL